MITWNWKRNKPFVYMDIETQSIQDIRAVGGRRYAQCPSTRIACAVFMVDGFIIPWLPENCTPPGDYKLDLPNATPVVRTVEPPRDIVQLANSHTFVAHNASGFDALVWDRCTGVSVEWCDTLPAARGSGLPGGLDDIGRRLHGTGKDRAGPLLIKMLSVASVRGPTYDYPRGTPALWNMMLRYCGLDVVLLRTIADVVEPHYDHDRFWVDRMVNTRGIPVDLMWARELSDLYQEIEDAARGAITNEIDNVRSVPQVRAWLRKQGFNIDSIERKELERFFADPDGYRIEGVEPQLEKAMETLRLRQQIVSAGSAKPRTILTCVDPDSRMREQHVVNGAHTGRFTGRELQPHNFPRGDERTPVDVEAIFARRPLTAAVVSEYGSPNKVLSHLVRPCIRAADPLELLIADYGQIEARVLAWLAGDQKQLSKFRDPSVDIYMDLAERIYGHRNFTKKSIERWVAKQAELGAGYQMSGAKFEVYCGFHGVDIAAAGTTPQAVIKNYRELHPDMVNLWSLYGKAARGAVESWTTSYVGRCEFSYRDGNLLIQLPSGRYLVYRKARMEMRVPGWAGAKDPVPTLIYDRGRGGEGYLYGGRIAENVTQAAANDLLVDALVRLERTGLRPVMHVHDEIVCEHVPESLDEACVLMSQSPSWAQDLPILVEGFTNKYYIKAPTKLSRKCSALMGRILE